MSAEHEKSVADLSLVSHTNAEISRKESERIQLSMSREIADLVDKLEDKAKEIVGLNGRLDEKDQEKKKLLEKVTELNQELALAGLGDDQKKKEIQTLNIQVNKCRN